jgi:hypothetical protein
MNADRLQAAGYSLQASLAPGYLQDPLSGSGPTLPAGCSLPPAA